MLTLPMIALATAILSIVCCLAFTTFELFGTERG
jgi:hypothetical protein